MTLTKTDFEAVRRVYLFSGMGEEEFLEIMVHATSVALAPGQLLFNQGDPALAFFWVAEGVIRLFRASPQGDEKVIELAGANRLFAEATLFMGGRYPVNAVAQTPSRLIAFDSHAFKGWLAQDTDRCFRLMAGMSARPAQAGERDRPSHSHEGRGSPAAISVGPFRPG